MEDDGSCWVSGKVTVVLGAQWGDEGKGKLVDLLAEGAGAVARCQGGNNAGHTVVADGRSYAFHMLPSGMVHRHVLGLLGNGVVIHVPDLLKEMADNVDFGQLEFGPDRLKISSRAHLVFDLHQALDGLQETARQQDKVMLGTTKKGIGPAYASKASRSGLLVADLVADDFEGTFVPRFRRLIGQLSNAQLQVDADGEIQRYREIAQVIKPHVVDSVSTINGWLRASKRVLVEGANAAMLDIDFGTYPYVTSSNCSVGGVLTGLGIPPRRIGPVFGVVKAYTTRVGAGAFPTEQLNEVGERLQSVGREFGVTTGRKRRCGWLDIPLLRYTHMINDYSAIALTKLDILDGMEELKIGVNYLRAGQVLAEFPCSEYEFRDLEVEYVTLPGWSTSISGCRAFEELPENARKYVETVEGMLGVPVRWIGVGQARDAVIERKST